MITTWTGAADASGDLTVVAAPAAGEKIVVYGFATFVATAHGEYCFRSGTADIFGSTESPLAAGGVVEFAQPHICFPKVGGLFECAEATALIIELITAAADYNGIVQYGIVKV